MADFLSVYITTSSRNEAENIARRIVEERLASCANILGAAHSIYRWNGKVHAAEEVALILKTRSSLFAQLELRVKELHSYDCPCIVAWPIAVGHAPYLNWITTETEAT